MFFKRPAFQVAEPTPPLTKITAPAASDITKEFTPQPAAQQLLTPEQTPAQYLDVLQQNHQSEDAVKLLAHGMPERESVWWATQSAGKVADPADAAEQAAIKAAETWVKNPTAETQAAAAAAAGKTNLQSPGAWAAQGAAWSGQKVPVAPNPAVPAAPAAMRLTPVAVTSAVTSAAAKSAGVTPPKVPAVQTPEIQKPKAPELALQKPKMDVPELAQTELTKQEQAKWAEVNNPFIKLGVDVARGANTWA